MARILLTDIEGTTSAIDFVHRVLFPYSRERLPAFVHAHAAQPGVRAALDAVRAESGAADDAAAVETLLHWIDIDRKATPLKTLQGLIWEAGYAAGDFSAHVYVDAFDRLRQWQREGVPLYVYSSGSVAAQKLFFAHSVFGDLLPWFAGHFDTHIGGKREAESYRRIAAAIGVPAGDILFLSDIEAELDAARGAGMATTQLLRPDTLPESHGRHASATSFREIRLDGGA
ncbi:MAG: acireductone synthase [Xanthomonadales bacterium]|jgi:enolase-phosphatase E1|nr:acireductone synthase [Xanthomonadales bacterium]